MKQFMLKVFLLNAILVCSVLRNPACALGASGADGSKQDIARLEQQLTEVRRDQLNYQIERDLLKETYSSNLQTINILLALILGAFSFIGFFGLRDIGTLKKEYSGELEELRTTRKDFIQKSKTLENAQQRVQADYLDILKRNEDQGKRIKVLELKEKADEHFKARNYDRVLEYMAVALEIDPKNTALLSLKGNTQLKLLKYREAIGTYRNLLELDPGNQTAAVNSLELSLFLKDVQLYQELSKKYGAVAGEKSEAIQIYFEALALLAKNDGPGMNKILTGFIPKLPAEKFKESGWDFADALVALKNFPDNPTKKLFLTFVQTLNGQTEPAILKAALKAS